MLSQALLTILFCPELLLNVVDRGVLKLSVIWIMYVPLLFSKHELVTVTVLADPEGLMNNNGPSELP